MGNKYIISIDQSTQGTKALLFSEKGNLCVRTDLSHRQIVNEQGWVSHDGEEIYRNTMQVIRNVLKQANVSPDDVVGIGISNQRETAILWDRESRKPMDHAVVWQCARAAEICERKEIQDMAEQVRLKTGLKLSPYFTAAKICWLLENAEGAAEKAKQHKVCHGTIDAYLVYRMTKGEVYATDYSNASRTQLFNVFELKWDEEICRAFGIDAADLPEVRDSNACFGYTDCEGLFAKPVPIHAVMGDSHAALFGQNCRSDGKTKVTYGTGSSIMMNIGTTPLLSSNGLVTSLAWGVNGRPEYVLEGNLNYTGAVISWLKDDVKLIGSASETEVLAKEANKDDGLYLVPAFTGLGAPYWDSNARAAVIGMDRTTGKAELTRAALESIAYQITDIVRAMEKDSQKRIEVLRVDGGPTKNRYLMQFQSDIAGSEVAISRIEELSGTGVAFMAGMALGLWGEEIFDTISWSQVTPKMEEAVRERKFAGYKDAVGLVRTDK
ncbi:MAG: glycerol kinase GlpK [Lachnospiraceae bacterium]